MECLLIRMQLYSQKLTEFIFTRKFACTLKELMQRISHVNLK